MSVERAAGIKEDADTRKAARIFQGGWGSREENSGWSDSP